MANVYSSKRRISVEEIQQRFNQSIAPRINDGQYSVVERSRTPTIARHLLPGSHTVISDVFDRTGRRVAVVHHFELPHGEIGASGQYDPKALFIGREMLYCGGGTPS